MTPNSNITVVAAINDHSVSKPNLLRSSLLLRDDVQFVPAEGFSSASSAYNYGLTKALGEILIFAHQDVYIPHSWRQQVLHAVAAAENLPLPWAVLGVVGVNDGQNMVKGCSWSTGLAKEVGFPVNQPEAAVSLDELILVVRKSSGLLFDENLPGWHLYGTDIVQTALEQGLGAYIIHAPVIHNSLPVMRLDSGFSECYRYLCSKWRHRLPIQTCCIRLARFGLPLYKKRIRQIFVSADRSVFSRLVDPAAKARELGYE